MIYFCQVKKKFFANIYKKLNMKNIIVFSIFKKIVIFLILISISSCGNNEAQKKEKFQYKRTKTEQSKQSKSNPSSSEKEISIIINSDDFSMKFDKKEIIAFSGQKITLTLNHTGKLDKLVMGHNFVLLKKGVNSNEFGIKASSEKEKEYIPDGGNQVIVHTKLIGGGESDTITFDAPEKGTYEFICSFPGHYMSMKGKLIIK